MNPQIKPKIEVYFVRHASGSHMLTPDIIAGRSLDAVLTPEGEIEAVAKGKNFASRQITFDQIVSSEAVRCVQTTTGILTGMGITMPITTTTELLEMDQGDSAGQLRGVVYSEAVLQRISEQGKEYAHPNGESMSQVGQRGMNWLHERETMSQSNISILAVAHAGLIACTVGELQGWDQPRTRQMLKAISPISETVLVFDGEHWQTESFAVPLYAKVV